MINPSKLLFSALLLASLAPLPAWAKGEITVDYDNGDTDIYSGVEISNTPDILYFKPEEGDSMLLITKNECTKEGEILVCNKARVGVETHGVIEELEVEQIFLFINPTNDRQAIKGSKITMNPNTILLEVATKKGTYIVGLGKIDSTTRPAEASR